MSSYSAKELIKILEDHGWYEVRQIGSHKQFRHPTRTNKITVPVTKVKKNIEMQILRQAGLKHLMKRRNVKPQPKRVKKVEPPYIHDGYLQVIGKMPEPTIENVEAAKNTPCFEHTIKQLEKLATKEKEKTTMPKLGEIARVTYSTSSQAPTRNRTSADTILEYMNANPSAGYHTNTSELVDKIWSASDRTYTKSGIYSMVVALIKRGELKRKKVSVKGGHDVVYNITLPKKDIAKVKPAQSDCPVVEPKPVPATVPELPKLETPVTPTVEVKKTEDGGIALSITLNLNINLSK